MILCVIMYNVIMYNVIMYNNNVLTPQNTPCVPEGTVADYLFIYLLLFLFIYLFIYLFFFFNLWGKTQKFIVSEKGR